MRRISGSDRYATSVAMAKHFGGWWPTGRGVDFAGALLCVASSSFYNDGSSAWSDALVAGPFCGAASGAAAAPKPPERAFAPVNGIAPGVLLPPTVRTKDAVPIILIAPNRETLPPPVEASLLGSGVSTSETGLKQPSRQRRGARFTRAHAHADDPSFLSTALCFRRRNCLVQAL